VPFVGAIPHLENQFISAGHHGHGTEIMHIIRSSILTGLSGMARIATVSRGLAKIVQGESWSATGLPESFQVTEERLAREVDHITTSS
jgi:hypothetical protein